jgi:hypothetical protein
MHSRLQLTRFRGFVWHAGFEQSKQAEEIVHQIQKIESQINENGTTVPMTITTEQKQLLAKLKAEYKHLTGESYDG